MFDQLGGTEFYTYLLFAIRILVAVGAGIVGWYVSPPLVMMASRLFYREPASNYSKATGRLLGAVGLGLLAFFLIHIGWGGGGIGIGGSGTGFASNKDKNAKKQDDVNKDKRITNKKDRPKETLYVEMVLSENYKTGTGNYYLIDKQAPPKSLDDVRQIIAANNKHWGKLEIIIYANSVARSHAAVKNLQKFAEDNQLEWSIPPEYPNKIKTANSTSE